MKSLYDKVCFECSHLVTKRYSTSFSLAVKTISPKIRRHIYSIYGFVRFADEIVDSFHDYDKEKLITDFEEKYYEAINEGISINPILNAFQQTVKEFNIGEDLVKAFLASMKQDLVKFNYRSEEEINEYVYGSADVVGLMCLKVFVNGNEEKYQALRRYAASLGSAFQKVNFLRDLKNDHENLHRSYFPNTPYHSFTKEIKEDIIRNIEHDFQLGMQGIKLLPNNSKMGVYLAYIYYRNLLRKLSKTPSMQILEARVRISNLRKFFLFLKSYLSVKLGIV